MKSKKKQRLLALILSMVLMLSASISAMAEGEGQTEASGTENMGEQVSAQNLDEETTGGDEEITPTETEEIDSQSLNTPEVPVQEYKEQETTGEGTPVQGETNGEPVQEVTEEPATETTEISSQSEEQQTEEETEEVIEETAEETEDSTETDEISPAFEENYMTEDESAVVHAKAAEGVFPEGTTLYAERISEESENYDFVSERLDGEASKEGNVVLDFVAYDITFYDNTGNEIEPNGNVEISIDFINVELEECVGEDGDLNVVHIKDNTEIEKVEGNIETEGSALCSASFTENQFSIYAITSTGREERENSVVQAGDYAVIEFWDKNNSKTEIKFTNKDIDDETRNIKIYVYFDGENVFESQRSRLEMSDSVYDNVNMQITVKPGINYYLEKCVWEKAKSDPSTFGGSGSAGFNKGNNILKIYLKNQPENSCTSELTNTKSILVDLYNYDSDAYNRYVGVNENSLLIRSPWTETYKTDNYGITSSSANKHNTSCGTRGIYYELASMVNGNIVFTKKAAFFDNQFTSVVGTKYSDVKFEFEYDESTKEYSYKSGENHVHFDEDANTIRQYTGQGPNVLPDGSDLEKSGFFPFTDENDNMTDYGFGMRMDVDFLLTDEGKLDNGENMKFSFSGDDDVWVFIDGQLALDLGGIHSRRGGTIDFASKTVTYDKIDGKNVTSVSSGKEETPNADFLKDLASGEHTLTMYYLERGGNDSNCEITFNLLVVNREGTLEFNKVDSESKEGINNVEFSLYQNSNITTESVPVATAISDVDGKVSFDISNLDTSKTYYLKETSNPFGYETNNTIYEVKLDELKTGQTIKVSGVIKDNGSIVSSIENIPKKNSGGTTDVTVEKKWGEGIQPFPVEMTLYAGENKVSGNGIENPIFLNTSNWSYTWANLPGDTDYTVVETVPEKYHAESEYTYDFVINKPYETVKPCNVLERELGSNGVVAIKKGNKYFIWTTVELNDVEKTSLRETINTIENGFGENNTTFGYGTGTFNVLDGVFKFDYSDGKLNMSINKTNAWSWFLIGNYKKSVNVIITNDIDSTETINIPVNKIWTDGNENHQSDTVTVQLYKKDSNGEPVEVKDAAGAIVTKVLSTQNNWAGIFENLLYWDTSTKEPIEYLVKETYINQEPIVDGKAGEYSSTVSKNPAGGFTVTNSLAKIEIDLRKYGTDYKGDQKSGAVFDLYQGEKSAETINWNDNRPIKEQIAVTSENTKELELEPGYYYLKEVTAPVGYSLLDEKIYFYINSSGTLSLINSDGSAHDTNSQDSMWRIPDDNTLAIEIKNKALYSLPSAGGPGIFLYMIGGTLLLIAGSLMIYINRRREVLRR